MVRNAKQTIFLTAAAAVAVLVVVCIVRTPVLRVLRGVEFINEMYDLPNVLTMPFFRKQPICVEDNICKRNPGDSMYYYARKADFADRTDAKIQYETICNITHASPVVPRIVHFVQFSNRGVNGFKFHHMLSVMSASKFIKPDKLYFWLDIEPTSSYWKELRTRVPEMILVQKEKPTTVRGRKVAGITNYSNVIRIEVVLEYGGTYMDLDIIALKSLDPLRGYDITMGYETSIGLCGSFIMAKPWTEFMRLWHQYFKTFNHSIWGYHVVILPAKIAKQYPNLIHTEWKSINRPSWAELPFLYGEGNLYDWRSNNYVCHLWIRQYRGKHIDETMIKTWNTTVGEMFRYVYYDDWRIIP